MSEDLQQIANAIDEEMVPGCGVYEEPGVYHTVRFSYRQRYLYTGVYHAFGGNAQQYEEYVFAALWVAEEVGETASNAHLESIGVFEVWYNGQWVKVCYLEPYSWGGPNNNSNSGYKAIQL